MFLSHIEKIAATSSRKEKEGLLMEVNEWDEENRDSFLKVLMYAYSPMRDFYIKDVSFLKDVTTFLNKDFDIGVMFDLLDILSDRVITGNEAREHVRLFFERRTLEDAELFRRIITRDLRCGISAKTINKVFPELVYEHPYMRCSTLNEKTLKKLKFPCFTQVKLDGLYVDAIISNTGVDYRSRQGKALPFNNKSWDAELIEHFSGRVLQGEALVLDETGDGYLPREEGNGYINSDDADPSRIVLIFWDNIDAEDFFKKSTTEPYHSRLTGLIHGINQCTTQGCQSVQTSTCNNFEDIVFSFAVARNNGEEGTVVKNNDMPWKDGTSPNQLKVKVVVDCDLKIVGYNEGNGKYEGMVGSIVCESADGIVEVGVSGFSDAFRKEATTNIQHWIDEGKIMTVRYNDVLENELKPGMKSLFLPRFVELREDKSDADDLKKITEQLEQFKLV